MDKKARRLGRRQEDPARRSHSCNDRRRKPVDQAASAYCRVAESHIGNNVDLASAAHDQAQNIPVWARQPDRAANLSEFVPDRPIASDRGLSSSSTTNIVQPLLTVGQAAERLNVSTKTIRRLIVRRDLFSVRIGRAIRIRETDIQGIMTVGSSR